jgi:hypothetical protein
MRLIAKLSCAAAVAAAMAVTLSAANAQPRLTNRDGYIGSDYVYGANRAPYGADEDNARDFQLQGTH